MMNDINNNDLTNIQIYCLEQRDKAMEAFSSYTMAGDVFFKSYTCPSCKKSHDMIESNDPATVPNFCSHCGQRVKIIRSKGENK